MLVPSIPVSSRRAQAAERNVRLDPQGIYGTRSARRQNQLRRRRQLQNLFLWLIGLVAAGFLIWWGLQPRQTLRGASWTRQLPFRPASPPLLAPLLAGRETGADSSRASLFFTSQSGGLWRWSHSSPETRPRRADSFWKEPTRVFSTGFAPAATPLVSGKQVFWPGGDGVLRAIDSGSGVQKWRGVFGSALACTPAVAKVAGREIVAAGDDSGVVAAFDAKSGAPKWKTNLGGAVGAAMAVFEGVSATKNEASADFLVPTLAGTTSRGGLVCLDGKSGRVKWRFPGDARSQSAGGAAPLVQKNRVFWGNDEGAVVCLDARTGQKIWKNYAAPAKTPGEKKPGRYRDEQGSAATSLRGGAALSEAAGTVVFGGNDGFLHAFDLATGAARWRQNLGAAARFPAQATIFENRAMFLAAGDAPAIFLLEARTGRVERRWTTPFPVSSGMTEAGGNIYALDAGGLLQVAALK